MPVASQPVKQSPAPTVSTGLTRGAGMVRIPLLSAIPVLGNAFSVATKMKTVDELLVVVTPHIGSGMVGKGSYIRIPTRVPK